ncbi:MAG: NYN domain-containing protein [Chloroflexota bacterium]|nr:NYN domain-containing protein [Chloroflexota bacterium]
MLVVIDGHNLIGVIPDIDLADPDDEWQLVQRLRSYCAATKQRLTVVFDPGEGSSPGWALSSQRVQVRFAAPGQEADALILQIVGHHRTSSTITVVTNDRALSNLVRAAGGQVRSASEFARHLLPSSARSTPVDDPIDPRDPAFADIFDNFVAADKDAARFGTEHTLDPAPWIEQLYGDDVGDARTAARWLGRFGHQNALEPLLDALTHSHRDVRAAALLALGILGDKQAVAATTDRLIHDRSAMVREAAAQSLARLGGQEAEAALRAARSDPKGKVRKAASTGLVQIKARKQG